MGSRGTSSSTVVGGAIAAIELDLTNGDWKSTEVFGTFLGRFRGSQWSLAQMHAAACQVPQKYFVKADDHF